jgi:hypothetical protein
MSTSDYPKRLHIIRIPDRIHTVSYSSDANYFAVCGDRGLIVFEQRYDRQGFIPKFQDIDKDRILSLQWVEADLISALRQSPNSGLYTERLKVPSTSKTKQSDPLFEKEYNYCKHWKLHCCQVEKEIEETRQAHLALGTASTHQGFYSPIGNKSLAIYALPHHSTRHIELRDSITD